MEQREKSIRENEDKIQGLIASNIKLHLKRIEKNIEENTERLVQLSSKIDSGMNLVAKEIAEAVIQSFKSAEDVNQRVIQRFKKIKMRQSK